MKKRNPNLPLILPLLILLSGVLCSLSCSSPSGDSIPTTNKIHRRMNGIYYWRTVFSLSDSEREFLKRENIGRLYLRMFDVTDDTPMPVPNATLAFAQPVPRGIEVVPTVFVTVEALRHAADSGIVEKLAGKIATRIMAMCSWNGIDNWHEIQLDCDWTKQTQEAYFTLCREVKKRAGGRLVSSTIRLHQLTQQAPPVDYGVLMVYNTDRFNSYKTRNSILDITTVETYLRNCHSFRLPLDVALPIFEWDILFRDETFVRIMKRHNVQPGTGETVRHEEVSASELEATQRLLNKYLHLEPKAYSTILYHLDSANIKKYSHEAIKTIYNN
ncbi:MAG: hypothetical protein ACI3Y5_04980 [Prevotella sp.]